MTVQLKAGTSGLMDPQFRSPSGCLENLMAMKQRTASCKQKANTDLAGLTSTVLIARLSSAKCPYLVNKLPLLLLDMSTL